MNQHKEIADYELSDVGSVTYTFFTAKLFKKTSMVIRSTLKFGILESFNQNGPWG